MRRERVLASAIALGAAVFCGGPTLALEGAEAGASGVGPSGVSGGDIGHIVVGGGGYVASTNNFGPDVVEGRSVGIDSLNGNAFWFGFYSPCFPYGYNYAYPYGPYGVCPPK